MIENPNWERLREVAKSYKGGEVLYCLTFGHGLMKVGRTKDMPRRLEALSAHGLLKGLAMDLIVQRLHKSAPHAEALAIKKFAGMAEQHGREVFSCLDEEAIRSVLLEASNHASRATRSPAKPRTHEEFDALARSSGMYAVFLFEAIDRAKAMGLHERAEELASIAAAAPPAQLNEKVRALLYSN